MQPQIVCLGEPLLEFNQVKDKPYYLPGHGGDTSNCAIAAARQGASVGYICQLGDDEFGDSFLRLWATESVDTNHVIRHPVAHTGIYFVTHTAQGHAFTYLRAGSAASRIRDTDIPERYIAEAKILHVSGISQAISADAADAVFKAIGVANSHGTLVSYDTNLRLKLWPLDRARAVIHEAMRHCDVALPGMEDAAQLTGLVQPDAIVDFYLGLGAGTVALTLGREGTLVATREERQRISGYPAEAVDATAAGDTFDGAFLAELTAGADPFSAARYANAAAALSTQGYGAVTPIPCRAEVVAFMERH